MPESEILQVETSSFLREQPSKRKSSSAIFTIPSSPRIFLLIFRLAIEVVFKTRAKEEAPV
jgi:hypothetical protein